MHRHTLHLHSKSNFSWYYFWINYHVSLGCKNVTTITCSKNDKSSKSQGCCLVVLLTMKDPFLSTVGTSGKSEHFTVSRAHVSVQCTAPYGRIT